MVAQNHSQKMVDLLKALGLNYHENIDEKNKPTYHNLPDGWWPDDNHCYDNNVESCKNITAVLTEILSDKNVMDYVLDNVSVFKHYYLKSVKSNVEISPNGKNIYPQPPPKEVWNKYIDEDDSKYHQTFRQKSWTWITSIGMCMIMHIYH